MTLLAVTDHSFSFQPKCTQELPRVERRLDEADGPAVRVWWLAGSRFNPSGAKWR